MLINKRNNLYEQQNLKIRYENSKSSHKIVNLNKNNINQQQSNQLVMSKMDKIDKNDSTYESVCAPEDLQEQRNKLMQRHSLPHHSSNSGSNSNSVKLKRSGSMQMNNNDSNKGELFFSFVSFLILITLKSGVGVGETSSFTKKSVLR